MAPAEVSSEQAVVLDGQTVGKVGVEVRRQVLECAAKVAKCASAVAVGPTLFDLARERLPHLPGPQPRRRGPYVVFDHEVSPSLHGGEVRRGAGPPFEFFDGQPGFVQVPHAVPPHHHRHQIRRPSVVARRLAGRGAMRHALLELVVAFDRERDESVRKQCGQRERGVHGTHHGAAGDPIAATAWRQSASAAAFMPCKVAAMLSLALAARRATSASPPCSRKNEGLRSVHCSVSTVPSPSGCNS